MVKASEAQATSSTWLAQADLGGGGSCDHGGARGSYRDRDYKALGWSARPEVGGEAEGRRFDAAYGGCLAHGERSSGHSARSFPCRGRRGSFCFSFGSERRRRRRDGAACGSRGGEGWRQIEEVGAADGKVFGWPGGVPAEPNESKSKASSPCSSSQEASPEDQEGRPGLQWIGSYGGGFGDQCWDPYRAARSLRRPAEEDQPDARPAKAFAFSEEDGFERVGGRGGRGRRGSRRRRRGARGGRYLCPRGEGGHATYEDRQLPDKEEGQAEWPRGGVGECRYRRVIYLSELIEIQSCCVQAVAQCPAEKAGSIGEYVRRGYGRGFFSDEGGAWGGGEEYLRPCLDRAQVEVAVLPQHHQTSMGVGGDLRLLSWRSGGRSQSESAFGNCSAGPIVAGQWQLADGARNVDGGAASFRRFSGAEASGELGTECFQVGGGESSRGFDVEAEGQGCFQRGSQTSRLGETVACGSAGEGEPPFSRSKTEERSRKRSKRRKVSAAEGNFGGRESRVDEEFEDRGQPPPENKEGDVPGAGASVVHAARIWSSAFGIVCRSRTRLALALFAAKTSPSSLRAPSGRVWPCPLPFPELHQKKANRRQVDAGRKLALNYLVLVMDVFHNGQSHFARAVPGLGTPLNKEQWEMIRRWSPLVDEWNMSCPITPEIMGRSAAKVENVEKVIGALQEEAVPIARDLRSYLGKKSGGLQAEVGSRDGAGEVVGKLRMQIDHVAKALQPERLKFWKVPSFEASRYLDAANRATFLRPFDYAAEADPEVARPPAVRVRMREKDTMRFLGLLDATKRLALVEETKVRKGFECGAFAVPKDSKKDRMVLDARPPNTLEVAERRWIHSLGSTNQLNHFFIEETQVIRLFAEDLREFYHCFFISEQRVLRNAFKLRVLASQVRHLAACDAAFGDEDVLVPCLNTMAMGDVNAVAYGQTAHLGVLIQKGLLKTTDLIALKKRPPRGDWFAGLMIDDLVIVEKVAASASEELSERSKMMQEIHAEYEKVGLPRHEGKSVAGEKRGSFWGVQLDGVGGRVRPNLSRAVPLVRILADICETGYATVGLLELVAGSLVSVFQLKRRFMSNLDAIYAAQRGRSRSEIVAVSDELKDELLSSIALVVLAEIDFRLEPSPYLVASDASMKSEAAVRSRVGCLATAEFQRHGLQKGLWSRLLRPEQAYLREKDMLEPELQLPAGEEECYQIHPIWQEVCETQPFQLFGAVREIQRRRHINLGEIDAALKAEEAMGMEMPRSFYVHLQDSQVSLAALIKGRSSSSSINQRLKRSIAAHAGSGIRPFYGFVDSARNPADDPTRRRQVRKPVRKAEAWLESSLRGEFEELDEKLWEQGVHLDQISGLPEESELYEEIPVDTRTRRQRKADGKRRAVLRSLKIDAEDEREKRLGRMSAEAEIAGDEKISELAEAEEEGRHPEVVRKGAEEENFTWAEDLLSSFGEDQFLYNKKKFSSLRSAVESGPGILDLFSGARGFARRAVELGAPWVVTFDTLHHPDEDLSKMPLQEHLVKLICSGAFLAMGAGPVCSSFSTAITPATRTKQFPSGVPWASALQKIKNAEGNEQLAFVLRLVSACIRHSVVFWVENPDSSWIWRQEKELSWKKVLENELVGDLRLDYCRFGTPWRKRTRFRTNSHLRSQHCFCRCETKHVQLRGRCKSRRINFTKLAEPYPSGVCDVLAKAVLIDCGWLGNKRNLDVSACARCLGSRIGEASHPGPRPLSIAY